MKNSKNSRFRKNLGQSGGLLIEVLAAMGIVTVWITGILMLSSNLMILQVSEKRKILALNVADTIADEMQSRLYIDLSWSGQYFWAYDETGRKLNLPATTSSYTLVKDGTVQLATSTGTALVPPTGLRYFAVSNVTRDKPIYGMNTASVQVNWFWGTQWSSLSFEVSR